MKSMVIFFSFLCIFPSYAYRSQGVENIKNIKSFVLAAEKEGLRISSKESNIKKEIQRLKKKNPESFKNQIDKKLENSNEYQGYLLEVRDGLKNIETAKQIAKLIMYQKIQEDWEILRTTIFNSYGASSFQKARNKIMEQLNTAVYVPAPKGFSFEFGNWGIAVVYPSLTTVQWKIQFNAKNDGNILEEGADKIKIQDGSGASSFSEDF